MYKSKINEKFKNEANSWENYDLKEDLTKGIKNYGYYYPFNFFKENWKSVCSPKCILSYNFDDIDYKNVLISILCLHFISPHLFNVQTLFIFSNDIKAFEFYEIFSVISKKMKLRVALILEQNKIVDDIHNLSKENPEIVIGSVKRIDYVIKKHYLSVFSIKKLIIDIVVDEITDFNKDVYEDVILMMPENTKRTILFLENDWFRRKYIKKLDKIL